MLRHCLLALSLFALLPGPPLTAQEKKDTVPKKVEPKKEVSEPKKEPTEAERQRAEAEARERAEAAKDTAKVATGLGIGMLILYFVLWVVIGMLPTWIAAFRRHPNLAPILLINLLLSWTCIGWIVALVWSVTAFDRPLNRRYRRDDYDD